MCIRDRDEADVVFEMKNFVIVSLFSIFSFQCSTAQQNVDSNKINNNALILKFKVIPMIIPGTGIFASAGFEYCLKKRHSLSAEIGAYSYSLPTEDYDSVAKKYLPGKRLHNHSQHALFQYKYYLNEGKRRTLYLGVYSKFE